MNTSPNLPDLANELISFDSIARRRMRLGQTGKTNKLCLKKRKIPLLKLENHDFSMEWCVLGLLYLWLRNVVIASMKAPGGFSELIGALGPNPRGEAQASKLRRIGQEGSLWFE